MPTTAGDTLVHLRRRAEVERLGAHDHASRLHQRLPAAVAALRRLGAGRVWLFGSLATGAARPGSDVDLAAEGLPAEAWVPAIGELSRLLGADPHLVRLEEAPETLRALVLEDGLEL